VEIVRLKIERSVFVNMEIRTEGAKSFRPWFRVLNKLRRKALRLCELKCLGSVKYTETQCVGAQPFNSKIIKTDLLAFSKTPSSLLEARCKKMIADS